MSMGSRRNVRWGGLVAVLVAALLAGAAWAQGTILLGGVGPLSQPGAVQAGIDMRWAMQQAVADINAEGGVLGKQLKLVFYDTQNRPDVAATVARRLVSEDHVVGVVGEYHSGAALAQIPVYNKAGIPVIFSETWSDKITCGDPNDPNLPVHPATIFRIAPSSSYAGGILTDWLVNGLHAKKVVEIYEATDFGQSQAAALKSQLGAAGVQLQQVKVELNQADYSAILSRVAQQDPNVDAVVFDVTGESSYTVEQNAFDVGLVGHGAVPVVNQVAADASAFWRAVPDGAGSVYRYVGLTPAAYNDLTKSVAKRYTAKFGGDPKTWVFEAYDSVRLMADAIKRAGTTDPTAVVKALENTSYTGAQGTYSFPYGSQHPLPASQPCWLWHQWPNPPIQMVEYTKKNATLNDVAILWPPSRQTAGSAYIKP